MSILRVATRRSIYKYPRSMYNWSVDEEAMNKADPEGYQVWRLEQMINWGLGNEKLDEALVRKYWDKLFMDSPTRNYLEFLLWPNRPHS